MYCKLFVGIWDLLLDNSIKCSCLRHTEAHAREDAHAHIQCKHCSAVRNLLLHFSARFVAVGTATTAGTNCGLCIGHILQLI